MATLGIELCDVAFQAATCSNNDPHCVPVPDANGFTDWPSFAYFDGQKFSFGRSAEDQWFVHPRRVAHNFWARVAHEPSPLGPIGKPASFSELSFYFLRDFMQRAATSGAYDKIVIAAPGAYLKDAATEEEKVGLLLGMAGELKLPLAGIVDMACAALCDPHAQGFNPALPVVTIDLHMEGADITLLSTDEKLQRKDFIHLPQSGYAHLLKHLTGTMGNRFLRHTAFDILEDGRIEQMFFRQTKEFLTGGGSEHRYHMNTAKRAYEMLAKREQLASDAVSFVNTLVQSVQAFLNNSPHYSEPCTVALTDRTGRLPGIETKLRSAGFVRILRLPPGAAACGAARYGETGLKVADDVADVAVDIALPISLARRSSGGSWEARLQKLRGHGSRPAPTHVILDGIGHPLGQGSRFTIGAAGVGADVPLPDIFNGVDDCAIPLVRDGSRLFFVDQAAARETGAGVRTVVESGDRITIRCGTASADVLFAHCTPANGVRAHD
ncbi:MAG: hypothetical protein V4773_29135 [Verrucomicrobiota bacterium]